MAKNNFATFQVYYLLDGMPENIYFPRQLIGEPTPEDLRLCFQTGVASDIVLMLPAPQQLVKLLDNHGWDLISIVPTAYFDQPDRNLRLRSQDNPIHRIAIETYWFRRRREV